MAYIGNGSDTITRQEYNFVATEGQTTFVADYTVGYVDVFWNGFKIDSSEYVANNGTNIIVNNALKAGDKFSVIAYNAFNIANTYSKTEAETYVTNYVDDNVNISIPASRLLAGDITVTNEIVTQGMNTTLYTGNGSTQSVVTGIDMATQWGNDASEMFGGLVWLKSRSATTNNFLFDTLRGTNNEINSNTTEASATLSNSLTSFNSDGFSLGGAAGVGTNAATYASWNFQTTHRISGVTNHGKPYTCHYNPFTGFTIVKYEGSGIAGHEIPHHLGRRLAFYTIKNLSQISDWWVKYKNESYLYLSNSNAETVDNGIYSGIGDEFSIKTYAVNNLYNATGEQYIMYGWANSYKDEANKLIGNYEVGVYQGTGAAGNKVKTRGKPAWVMIKRLDGGGNWRIFDNQRPYTLFPSTSSAEINESIKPTLNEDGFTVNTTDVENNASGGQYLYMVAYDTNSDGGGSYYPRATDTSNVQLSNAQIMYSDGYANGTAKNSSEVLDGATTVIPSNGYVEGYNWIKKTSGGAYTRATEPKFGETSATSDYYIDGKWYSSVGAELGNITYLPIKVLADAGGQIVSSESWKYPEIVAGNISVLKLEVNKEITAKLPTADPFIKGKLWNSSGTVKISLGV